MIRPIREHWPLVTVLVVAFGIRCFALFLYAGSLHEDRDAYLAIATQLRERGEFASSPGNLTAYRPPLYPLVVVPIAIPDWAPARGALHLVLSMATLCLIWRIAGRLELPDWGRLAAVAICAVDPLLVRYLAFSMTETLSAFLATLLLDRLLVLRANRSAWNGLAAGLTFGLCVLTRPTFWVFGMLLPVATFLFQRWGCGGQAARTSLIQSPGPGTIATILATGLTVAPWVMRNYLMFGTPILMTTHGGYTILLGNNTAYYQEVVEQPWGTVWDGSRGPGQSAWINSLSAEMERQEVLSEVDQDRWMNRRAWRTIGQHPVTFLKACRLRFYSFWSVIPGGEWSSSVPRQVILGLAVWYSLIWIGFVAGLLNLLWSCRRFPEFCFRWTPTVLLVLSLVLVHLVYWTDARMRAPVMPMIALIAVAWTARTGRKPLIDPAGDPGRSPLSP